MHAYDPVALVLTMLPFHDTVLFVKLLQNVDLSKQPALDFLDNNIKHGLNIPRSMLVKQLRHEPGLFRTLMSMLQRQQALKQLSQDVVISSRGVRVCPLDTLFVNFLTAVAIDSFSLAALLSPHLLSVFMEYVAYALGRQQNNMVVSGLIVMQMMLHQQSALREGIVADLSLVLLQKISRKQHPQIEVQMVQFYVQLYQNDVLPALDSTHLSLLAQSLDTVLA